MSKLQMFVQQRANMRWIFHMHFPAQFHKISSANLCIGTLFLWTDKRKPDIWHHHDGLKTNLGEYMWKSKSNTSFLYTSIHVLKRLMRQPWKGKRQRRNKEVKRCPRPSDNWMTSTQSVKMQRMWKWGVSGGRTCDFDRERHWSHLKPGKRITCSRAWNVNNLPAVSAKRNRNRQEGCWKMPVSHVKSHSGKPAPNWPFFPAPPLVAKVITDAKMWLLFSSVY